VSFPGWMFVTGTETAGMEGCSGFCTGEGNCGGVVFRTSFGLAGDGTTKGFTGGCSSITSAVMGFSDSSSSAIFFNSSPNPQRSIAHITSDVASIQGSRRHRLSISAEFIATLFIVFNCDYKMFHPYAPGTEHGLCHSAMRRRTVSSNYKLFVPAIEHPGH